MIGENANSDLETLFDKQNIKKAMLKNLDSIQLEMSSSATHLESPCMSKKELGSVPTASSETPGSMAKPKLNQGKSVLSLNKNQYTQKESVTVGEALDLRVFFGALFNLGAFDALI